MARTMHQFGNQPFLPVVCMLRNLLTRSSQNRPFVLLIAQLIITGYTLHHKLYTHIVMTGGNLAESDRFMAILAASCITDFVNNRRATTKLGGSRSQPASTAYCMIYTDLNRHIGSSHFSGYPSNTHPPPPFTINFMPSECIKHLG